MPVLRPGRALALPLAALAALAAVPAAAHAAPVAPACKAEVLRSSLLTLPASLLVANAPGTPCAADAAGGALDLPVGLRAAAVLARTGETPATGPSDRRVRSASAEAADLDVDLVPLTGRAPLVRVGVLQSAVQAGCANGAPVLQHRARVQAVKLFGTDVTLPLEGTVELTSATLNGLLPGQVLRLTVDGWAPDADGRGGVATALRIELIQTVLFSETHLVDLSVGRTTASVGNADCTAVAPRVELGDGGRNRRVVATITAGTAAVADGTLAVRPQGSTGAYVDVAAAYDAATGTLSADLPRATFATGTYDVRATVVDADGRDASSTGVVTVAQPTAGTPVVSGRTVTAAAAAPRGTTLASCSFTLSRSSVSPVVAGGALRDGTCVTTLADDVGAGDYDVAVTVTDANGDTGAQRATGSVGAVPSAPSVQLVDAANRTVVGVTADGGAGPATSCAVLVQRAGSSAAATPVAATLSGGRCTASLRRADFPVGGYEVTVTATDAAGRRGSASGTIVIAAPVVGPIAVDGRTVTAPVQLASGTTAAGCTVVLSDASGPVAEVAGTVRDGVCTATVPARVGDGVYDVVVTATDSNGDTGRRVRTGVQVGDAPVAPAAPGVTPVASGVNRVAAVTVTVPAGETISGCTASVAGVGVPAAYDATTKRCSAKLGAGTFAAGDYDVVFTVTTVGGGIGRATAPVSVTAPAVGAPTIDGRDVSAPVTPAAGTPVTGCTVGFTAGGQTVQVTGTVVDGVCRATAPADLPAGAYEVTVRVVDVNGDAGAAGAPAQLAAPTDTGTGGAGTGPGTGGGTGVGAGSKGGAGGGSARPTPTVPATTAADLLTGCGGRRLVLVSVYRTRAAVVLDGVASRALAGQTVEIRASGVRDTVARAVVDAQGSFSARAKLRGVRGETRFVASVGSQRSLALKLSRRVQVASAVARDGKVTIRGTVTTPRPPKGQRIELRRLVACDTYAKEGTVRMGAGGRFVARVPAPDARFAVYRLVTRVPRERGDKPTTRTFSLPVVVGVKG